MKMKSIVMIGMVIFTFTNVSYSRTRYKIVDIHPRPSSIKAINDPGQIVGGSGIALLWDSNGNKTDLGGLGGYNSWASAINNTGQIAGYGETADGNKHAFFWDKSDGMIDLGVLDGSESCAVAINDSGQVVGSADINETVTTAPLENAPDYKVTRFINHAFIWDSNNGMIDIGTLGGKESFACAINNTGQVVGSSETASGERHLFIWDIINGMKDLGPLGDTTGYIGINNIGQVVATSWNSTSRNYVSFFWSNTVGVVYLDTLGVGGSETYVLNDKGQIVGWSTKKGIGGGRRACLWDSSGRVTDIGVIGDFYSLFVGTESMGFAISNAGQVVGWSGRKHTELGYGHAFLWDEKHGMVKLYDLLVDKSGWKQLISASHINDRGQIVGFGETNKGEIHAFLMSPVSKSEDK